jgi:hypothetical protein
LSDFDRAINSFAEFFFYKGATAMQFYHATNNTSPKGKSASRVAKQLPPSPVNSEEEQIPPETVHRMNQKLALHRKRLIVRIPNLTCEARRRKAVRSPFRNLEIAMGDNTTNMFGKHVYNICVKVPNGTNWTVSKRYSEILKLHQQTAFQNSKGQIRASCLKFPTDKLGVAKKSIKTRASCALHYERRRLALGVYLRQIVQSYRTMTPAFHHSVATFLGLTMACQKMKLQVLSASCSKEDKVYVNMAPMCSVLYRFDVELATNTVEDLKRLVQHDLGISCDAQRLVFRGRRLDEHLTLEQVGLEKGSTVHLALERRWLTTKAVLGNNVIHRAGADSPSNGHFGCCACSSSSSSRSSSAHTNASDGSACSGAGWTSRASTSWLDLSTSELPVMTPTP